MSRADMDPELTRQTRRALVERLEREQILVAAGHFEAPGYGRVVRLEGSATGAGCRPVAAPSPAARAGDGVRPAPARLSPGRWARDRHRLPGRRDRRDRAPSRIGPRIASSSAGARGDAGPGRRAHPPRQGAPVRAGAGRARARSTRRSASPAWPSAASPWRTSARGRGAVLDMAVRHGTTAMRSHVEVDPIVGLKGLEALLPLRDEYAPAIDLQLCAFAQEGILKAPGTEALLAARAARGRRSRRRLPVQRQRRARPDRHRLPARPGVRRRRRLSRGLLRRARAPARAVHRRADGAPRLAGPVAVGHVTELGALPPPEQDEVIAEIRAAGLGVIVLPATDLYLMGRARRPQRPARPRPVRRLLAAGVPVAAATNNVRNAFTPVGTANLPLMGFLVTVGCHMGTRAGSARRARHADRASRAHARARAARAWRKAPRADLVVWETERAEDVIAAMAPPALRDQARPHHGGASAQHRRAVENALIGPHRPLTPRAEARVV